MFFYLNQKGIIIVQDVDVFKVVGGEQSVNGVIDIFIINCVVCVYWYIEESCINGDLLQVFEMNVFYYEFFSIVYGGVVEQQ